MNKQEFLTELKKQLGGLPSDDAQKSFDYYAEMIDDRVEDGLSEQEAIAAIGNPAQIAKQILMDFPLPKLVRQKIKPKRSLKAWEIVLLVLGSPVWLPLLIAAFAVIFSLYIVLWSVIISLWAAEVSLATCSIGGVASGVVFICQGNTLTGIAMIGAGIVLAGLSVFWCFGCKAAIKGILLLTKKIALGIKSCFIKKEEA